ncbi:unnamed protein product [Moneuplotes crassus]|uniref:Uncharacterized protein n=1 Tax=Euplotes crassus TaxID=5936 RepID=A0AAD1X6R1_EUPCR|nr:unnamed protein product [Moneuplotes crassus]
MEKRIDQLEKDINEVFQWKSAILPIVQLVNSNQQDFSEVLKNEIYGTIVARYDLDRLPASVETLEKKTGRLAGSVDFINIELEKKATLSDFVDFKERITNYYLPRAEAEEFATQTTVLRLDDKVHSFKADYLSRKEFSDRMIEFRNQSEKLYCSKSIISQDINRIMTNLPKLDNEIKNLSEKSEKLNTSVLNQKDTLKKINQELSSKLDISYKVEVDENLAKFCKYQHIKDLKTEVNRSISKFKENIQKFKTYITGFAKDIKNSKEIIQRFDELICDKASKFELKNSVASIENLSKEIQKIQTTVDEDQTSEEIQEIYSQLKTLKNEASGFQSSIATKFDSSVESFSLQLEQNMMKFIDENCVTHKIVENIKDSISLKADEKKSSKVTKTLLKQISMLSVILVEKLRIESIEKEESEISKNKKQQYLLKQSISLQRWIDQFQNFENGNISQFVRGKHNITSLSMAPKGLEELKMAVDGEIDNVTASFASKIKSRSKSKVSSPRDENNSKNDRLFISSITPNMDRKHGTYFGNRAISKRFSIGEEDSYYPKISQRELMNKSESGTSMYISRKKRIATTDTIKTSFQKIKQVIKKKPQLNITLNKMYYSHDKDSATRINC